MNYLDKGHTFKSFSHDPVPRDLCPIPPYPILFREVVKAHGGSLFQSSKTAPLEMEGVLFASKP